MAAGKGGNSAVTLIRDRRTIALPPVTLGFASLTEPDTYDPDKPMFKMNAHLTPAAIPLFVAKIEKECYGVNLEKLRDDMRKNEKAWEKCLTKAPQPASDWLEAKLKEPKENARVQLPYLQLGSKAQFRDREGDIQQKSITAWDRANNVLNLKALKLGMGSVVEPIVHPNLFISKLIGFPQPTLDLVGVRIVKLIQYGGQRPPEEADDEAIKAVLGEDYDLGEDLSQYAAGGSTPAAPDAGVDEETVRQIF